QKRIPVSLRSHRVLVDSIDAVPDGVVYRLVGLEGQRPDAVPISFRLLVASRVKPDKHIIEVPPAEYRRHVIVIINIQEIPHRIEPQDLDGEIDPLALHLPPPPTCRPRPCIPAGTSPTCGRFTHCGLTPHRRMNLPYLKRIQYLQLRLLQQSQVEA